MEQIITLDNKTILTVYIILVIFIAILLITVISFHKKINSLEKTLGRIANDKHKAIEELKIAKNENDILKKTSPMRFSASLMADISTLSKFTNISQFIKTCNPNDVGDLKFDRRGKRDYVELYKLMRYRYDFLMELFPAFKDFIEDGRIAQLTNAKLIFGMSSGNTLAYTTKQEIAQLKATITSLSNENSLLQQIKRDNEEKINNLKTQFDLKLKKANDNYEEKSKMLNDTIREMREYIKDLEEKCHNLNEICSSNQIISRVAQMYADYQLIAFKQSEERLRTKIPPAYTKADEIAKYAKEKVQLPTIQLREMQYKYEYLLSVFPDLKRYVEHEESLIQLDNSRSLDDWQESIDHSRDYLSEEEYKNLSTDEKNQLALDRYIQSSRGDWIIGIEYEMYIAYLLRTKGYKTIAFGIENGLSDLGRDIIAIGNRNGVDCIFIIQCKNWSNNVEIHENTICQIYGTSIEYLFSHPDCSYKVIPVICTTTKLSSMASKFARALNVEVWEIKKEEYPRIKCNVNNGEKIYHLPFDQQYWKTKIADDSTTDFYAWTVKEAVEKGFRRAYRYMNNN